MIYEYCLVVNGHIVPYRENYDRNTDLDYKGDKPTVALLTVNKAVRKEAASIFYGKNVWRIASQADDLKELPTTAGENPKTIWDVHAKLFRRVIIYAHRLDVNDLDPHILSRIARSAPAKTLQERMARAHTRNFNRMLGCWSPKFSFVLQMPNLIS